MSASFQVAPAANRAFLWLIFMMIVAPMKTFADLRAANEPPPPPTHQDSFNAFVAYVIQFLLLAIAGAAFTWLLWWGVRMRRK